MPGHKKKTGVAGRRRRGGPAGRGRGRGRMDTPGTPPVKLPPTVARKKKRK